MGDRAYCGKSLLPIETELATRRERAGKTLGPSGTRGGAVKTVAQRVGLSHGTFERALEGHLGSP